MHIYTIEYNNRRLKICGLVAVKSLLQCFHLRTLLSFQSMTSENLCEPSPILALLGEILCEPRRLWRHGSRAPESEQNEAAYYDISFYKVQYYSTPVSLDVQFSIVTDRCYWKICHSFQYKDFTVYHEIHPDLNVSSLRLQ